MFFYLQKMTELHDLATVESNDNLNRPFGLAQNLPLTSVGNNEMVQLDDCLLTLRNAHDNISQKLLRKLRNAERRMQKKDVDIKSLTSEIARSTTELATTKAQLFGDLLVAERKIKQLEQELNDAKTFITQYILVANDQVSQLIRSRYGNGNELRPMKMTPAAPITSTVPTKNDISLELSNAIEEISTSLFTNPANDLESVTPSADAQTTSDGEPKPVEATDDNVVEVNNEEMETDDCAARFSCGQCPKLFSTLAQKYRHETKSHGNIDAAHGEEDDAEQSPKLTNRFGAIAAAKKILENDRRKKQKFMKAILNIYGKPEIKKWTPVMKELKRHQRAKKISGKNKN